MSGARLYLVASGEEIARRRPRVPEGRVIEAWPDAQGVGFWLGAESKALLDAADSAPIKAELSLPLTSVAIFYGPQLADLESLPSEESLATRVLSVHAVAVAWMTLDRFGQRNAYEPRSPADPIFHLRRPGTSVSHLWRLFHSKSEAVVALGESYGHESEAAEWAQTLAVDDFDALLQRVARPEPT